MEETKVKEVTTEEVQENTEEKSQKKGFGFWKIFCIYAAALVVVGTVTVLYVRGILQEYEETQPKYYVTAKMEEMVALAAEGKLLETHLLPDMHLGRLEADRNIKADYLALYQKEDIAIVPKGGAHAEDESYFYLKNGDVVLAEIKLKALGPAQTKLAILTSREWEVDRVKLVLEAKDYELVLPVDFKVSVNGVPLEEKNGKKLDDNELLYALKGMYLPPQLSIKDWNGKEVAYTFDEQKIQADFYSYNLTLPEGITVKVNGTVIDGEPTEKTELRYDILELEKPEVEISDVYGNVVMYDGGKLPLTYATLKADNSFEVQVAGEEVPEGYVTTGLYPEHEPLADYVEELPQMSEYHIAMLVDDAEIKVWDEEGEALWVPDGQKEIVLFKGFEAFDEVPEEVAEEIDVLKVAQNWSKFMSADLPFAELAKDMIKGSYQYDVARRYSGSVDITFISGHVLDNPAFTEEKVSNFTWITENAFSVDIHFIKHMVLNRGKKIEDVMNDRFYFVRYDGTKDGKDNATWKLASMKEIVKDAE